jgi:hypothetical protein
MLAVTKTQEPRFDRIETGLSILDWRRCLDANRTDPSDSAPPSRWDQVRGHASPEIALAADAARTMIGMDPVAEPARAATPMPSTAPVPIATMEAAAVMAAVEAAAMMSTTVMTTTMIAATVTAVTNCGRQALRGKLRAHHRARIAQRHRLGPLLRSCDHHQACNSQKAQHTLDRLLHRLSTLPTRSLVISYTISRILNSNCISDSRYRTPIPSSVALVQQFSCGETKRASEPSHRHRERPRNAKKQGLLPHMRQKASHRHRRTNVGSAPVAAMVTPTMMTVPTVMAMPAVMTVPAVMAMPPMPADLGGHAEIFRCVFRGGGRAGIGQRERLRVFGWSCNEQQSRNC